jgi:N-acetylmuramoyl-L-alanine amidase
LLYFKFLREIALILIALLILPGAAVAADTATIRAVRIGGDEFRTRIVLDVDRLITFAAENQSQALKLVIDLPGARFDLPAAVGRKPNGLIKGFSYGLMGGDKPQIIVETTAPVKVAESFFIPARRRQPARIVFDLVPDEEVPPVIEPAAAPERQPPPPPPPPSVQAKNRTIVIDPGHGGIDPGAVNARKVKEKDVVLAFSRELKAILGQQGYKVQMTREDDHFIILKDRVKFARDAKADLFIAIHADIIRGRSARGLTLYTLSERASDAEAEALAQKENRADLIAGVDFEAESEAVTDLLIELVQRESKDLAQSFTRYAVEALQPVTLMTGTPVRSAGFQVLKAPDVASVLIELGYLSSEKDEQLITSVEWQRKTATALAAAVSRYFAETSASASAAAAP